MVASTAVEWEDTPADEARAQRAAEIASLTGLRGLAALMVVLIHTSGRTEYDWIGLPTFGPVSLFVISGFLLYRPWARWALGSAERPALGSFFLRRATRIFPAYWLVLVVVAVVIPGSRPSDAAGWWRAVTLTWTYEPQPTGEAMLHTWSLATEVSWYVALPFLAIAAGVAARRLPAERAVWLCVAAISLSFPISIAWRLRTEQADLAGQLTYPYWLPSFLFCFAAGALVALLAEAQRAGIVGLGRVEAFLADSWAVPVVVLALGLLATSPLGGPTGFVPVTFAEDQVRSWSAMAMAWLLLASVVLGRRRLPLNRLLGTRWFAATGRWSYGIYLWHIPVIVVLERDLTFPDGPVGLLYRLAWILALSIPLGAATYAWVERPTMAWSRHPLLPWTRDRRERAQGRQTSASTSAHPDAPSATAHRSSSPDA
ncbi:acyltransferase family protein [Nocardioides xinjiangensis]|uniref:acyltransferase family protein n=1 Tax=Nocardioides xinjiangensis TaxID=2817376 RepID=UPI0027DE4519|nr:acyltransferase [Nocardioides sp. SYSU D00778]